MSQRSFDYEKVDELLRNAKSLKDIKGEGGVLQEMLKSTIERVMQAELEDELGYPPKDRSNKNENSNKRNGKYHKSLKTDSGVINIAVPRDRNGEYEPKIVRKYETIDSELQESIISMYAKGMTTRDISGHFKALYGTDISPTLISNVTGKVLESAQAWQGRSLDNVYPVVFLDAIHYKVRTDGKIISKAAYMCLGLNIEGKRDVLGIYIGESESSTFWLSVLTDLQNRGVEDILICCIDGLKGFSEAITSIYPKTEIQSCIIHQIRNSLRYVGSKHQKEFMKDLKSVYRAVSLEEAEANFLELEEKWGEKYPTVTNSWSRNWERLTAYFKYSEPIRKMIYTTNIVEGYHRQLRKVTKNRSIFPSDDSLFKMLYLATKQASEKWTSSRHNWAMTLAQLSIHFEGRLKLDLA